MAEPRLTLRPADASVVLCLGAAAALDLLPATPNALAIRIAADEVLVVGEPHQEAPAVSTTRAALRQIDAAALAIGMTDAWSLWSLSGRGAAAAFARLSAMPLPTSRPGVAIGAVCGIGARVLALPDRLVVMVSSHLGHHVRDRFVATCSDLGSVGGEPWAFVAAERRP